MKKVPRTNWVGLVAHVEFWLLILLVAVSFVDSAVLPWVSAVGLVFWFLRWLLAGSLPLRTPVDPPVILLALMVAVTAWVTAFPQVTAPQVWRLLAGIFLFYAVVRWAHTRERLRLWVFWMGCAILMLAAFSLVGVEWLSFSKLRFIPPEIYARLPVLVGDTANPNVLAGSLVLLVPLALGQLFFNSPAPKWLSPLFYLAVASVGITIVVLSQSRAAILSLGIALCVLVVLRWRFGWAILALGLASVLFAAGWLGWSAVLEALSAHAVLGGMAGRLEVWSRAVYMIQDFPFTGIGMGSFMRVADILYPFFSYPPNRVEHAHNLFLQIGVDLGIPGLLSWLSILAIVVFSAFQVWKWGRLGGEGWLSGLGVGLLASNGALVIHGMFDAVTWGMVRPAPIVWALWGLAIASWQVGVRPASSIKSNPQS